MNVPKLEIPEEQVPNQEDKDESGGKLLHRLSRTSNVSLDNVNLDDHSAVAAKGAFSLRWA